MSAPCSTVPSSQIQIGVSCSKLADKDAFSKSDPMCVCYTRTPSGQWVEQGRTERIKDTLDPEFVKKFDMLYLFEETQHLKFAVYDVDDSSANLSHHDSLGDLECTLAEIVSAGTLSRALAKSSGMIHLRAEEMVASREEITLQLRAEHLDKKDTFGKSDGFLEFHRQSASADWMLTHKTEVVKNSLNPQWRMFTISLRDLANGDWDRPILIRCHDWDSDGSHDFIGSFETTTRSLQAAATSGESFPLINAKKREKKGSKYKDSGKLFVMLFTVDISYTFMDYISGPQGTQINCTVAVDFTGSNGNPRQPNSLHYMNPQGHPNQYQIALRAVLDIIQHYDSDKLFPALGFGAKFADGRVSHEFFLNGHPENPYCQGIEGVLAAYNQALNSVQLWGPTNFAPCINHVAQFASTSDGSNYYILLIITDGAITDMPATAAAIVRASQLPMSIIIVGVGNADFSSMETLDGDGIALSARGQRAQRDIVQFVPLCRFADRGAYCQVQAALAKEVLAEIPTQFLSWMKPRKIKPRQPPPPPPTA